MKRHLLVSSILAATLAGCSGGGGDAGATNATADANMVEVTGSPATIGANGPSLVSTDTFVEQAAIGDMYEIEAAKIALARSKSAPIKDFAQMMIKDHGATTAKLKALLPTAGVSVTPPTALDERHATMIEDLRKADPDKFDKRYVDQQTQAHREALGLMDSYATHGDNAALKGFAEQTKPTIQMHLDTISKLDHEGADDTKGAGEKTTG